MKSNLTITADAKKVPNQVPSNASGNKPMRIMKLKLAAAIIALSAMAATTTVSGATIIWNGGDGTGTAIGAVTNWVGGVSPNSAAGDICQWDSTVPGNLLLTSTSANGNFNNGTPGVNFYIAAGHTGSWNLRSLIAGGGLQISP